MNIHKDNNKTKILRFIWGAFPWIIVIIIVIFIVNMGARIMEKKDNLDEAKKAGLKKEVPAVRVITLTLKARRLVDKINLPAQVEAFEEVWVKAEIPGQIIDVRVKEGQMVETGQVLVKLDDRDFRERLARIEANYSLAKQNYDRISALVRKNFTAPTKLDEIKAQLKDLAAQRNESLLALNRTSIKTPISSLLNKLKAKKGDFVAVGDPVAQILEIDTVKVTVGVPESDVASIFDLEEAAVIIEALGKQRVKGEKLFLSRKPSTLARLFDLELKVSNPDRRILPGMFARVELVKNVHEDALAVPLYAIITQDTKHFVFIEKNDHAEKRKVALGTLIGSEIHITSGLQPGEKVIVVGHRLLDNGQEVEVIRNVAHPNEISGL